MRAMLRYAPHAIGIFRRRGRGDRFLPHRAGGRAPVAARLRHDPGRSRCAGAQSPAVPVRRGAIDAVVLSHAHIDHCGRLPLLVKRGYRGPIYTNPACAELVPILLRDSAELAMRDAERANRDAAPGAERAAPLYDLRGRRGDARAARSRFRTTLPRELLPGITRARARRRPHPGFLERRSRG